MHRRGLLKRGIGLGVGLALAPLGTGVASAEERWVQTWKPAELWSNPGPTAVSFGLVRPFTYLRLHGDAEGGRIYVKTPKPKNSPSVAPKTVGPTPAPPPPPRRAPPEKAPPTLPPR